MGVVAVETRTVELSIPADPANLDSEAKVGHLKYICAVLGVPLYYSVHRYIESIASHQILEGRVAASLNYCTVITFKMPLDHCKEKFYVKS